MAKIENYHLIKKNIIIKKFEEKEVSEKLLQEYVAIEKQRISKLRELNRYYEILIPERHPLIEKKMIREKRLVAVSDVTKIQDRLMEWLTLNMVEYIDDVFDLRELVDKDILERINYEGEKYKKITLLLIDNREILRLSGVQKHNIF